MYQLKRGAYDFVSFQQDSQWACYRYFTFPEAPKSLTVCVFTGAHGGRLEVRKGTPDGPVIGSATLPDTGWKWKEITFPVENGTMEKETLYLVASQAPFSVKYFRFAN